jgi:hypothetical protein
MVYRKPTTKMKTNYEFNYSISGKAGSYKVSATADGDSIYLMFDTKFFQQFPKNKSFEDIDKMNKAGCNGYHFRFDGIGDWETENAKWRAEYMEETVPCLMIENAEDWWIDVNGPYRKESYRVLNPNDTFQVREY